ncbi:MAG: hypothetical protein PHW01_00040 [Patescibacteria group bacterium]|nr:hypothetical protein [Patescibacteria group bacterium]
MFARRSVVSGELKPQYPSARYYSEVLVPVYNSLEDIVQGTDEEIVEISGRVVGYSARGWQPSNVGWGGREILIDPPQKAMFLRYRNYRGEIVVTIIRVEKEVAHTEPHLFFQKDPDGSWWWVKKQYDPKLQRMIEVFRNRHEPHHRFEV